MTTQPIFLTKSDSAQLCKLVALASVGSVHDSDHLLTLTRELARAIVVDSDEVPSDVVTMHTTVKVRDLETGKHASYTLVYPPLADLKAGRISVLAPLGIALLGFREGDEIGWQMPGGNRRLRIERVLNQPEAQRRARSKIQRSRSSHDGTTRPSRRTAHSGYRLANTGLR